MVVLKNVNANETLKFYYSKRYNLKKIKDSKQLGNIQLTDIPENVTVNTGSGHLTYRLGILNENHVIVGKHTTENCWWHHKPFGTEVIPIPLRIISVDDQSQIQVQKMRKFLLKNNLEYNLNHFYLTEGVCCSPSCALAYIRHYMLIEPWKYHNSEQLLFSMLKDIYGQDIDEITPANDWRLLEGKQITEEEYLYNNIKLVESGISTPIMYNISLNYQEVKQI